MTNCPNTSELLTALRVALPYVQRIAATQPFEMNRQRRQLQAVKDAQKIKAAISQIEGAAQ